LYRFRFDLSYTLLHCFADLLPWFRIKMSMLLDLDKDYLKDMDITLMGDIINILKHARVVANRNTSEMVLSDKVPVTYKNATKY
jgi:hypothetical protein